MDSPSIPEETVVKKPGIGSDNNCGKKSGRKSEG
jgi:hypothetical protein